MATKTLQLPCGLETDGRVERAAEIGKLKGRVQRDVARIANKKKVDQYAVIEAILKPSVKMVGSEKSSGTILGALLLADRDYLLFEIVKFTRGAIVTLKDTCPSCKEKGEWGGFDLDTLEITVLDDSKTSWWDGQKVHAPEEVATMGVERIGLKYRVFKIEDAELGISGTFRYPTGRNQQAIMKMGDNEIEALWKLMSLNLLEWKDPERELEKAPPGGVKSSFWEDLDMDLLDWAQDAFADAMPGINSRVELECPSCDHEFKTVVRASDFLFRTPKKEGAMS